MDDASHASEQSGSPVMGIVVTLLLLLLLCAAVGVAVLCFLRTSKWKYRAIAQDLLVPKDDQQKKDYAKEELLKSFEKKSAVAYLASLELALEANVRKEDIPCVYTVQKVLETFRVPKVDPSVTTLTVQLCFILDYTGSMKTQIAQAKESVGKIIESMKKLKISSMPNAAVEVEMTAVAYNDWDPETKKKGRPIVSVFGGGEVKQDHDESLTAESFNLGGKWTKNAAELQKWINQDLGPLAFSKKSADVGMSGKIFFGSF